MFEWKTILTGHIERAETPLAQFHLCRLDSGMYSVAIAAGVGRTIASQGNIPTLDEARAWCEQTYRELLEAELRRFV